MKQLENELNTVFYETFVNVAEAIENCVGKFGNDKASLADGEMHQALDQTEKVKWEQIKALFAHMRDKFLAHACIEKTDLERLHDTKKKIEKGLC